MHTIDTLKLPYIHLNLRYNPFGELPPETRAVLAIADVEHFVPLLHQRKMAVQFTGDSGTGKSTHLLALHRNFPDAPFFKVYCGTITKKIPLDIVFIDEMQFLTKRLRNSIFKKVNALAFTTHIDFSEELSRVGFTVTTITPADSLNVKHLQRVFITRIEAARRAEGPIPSVLESTIIKLIGTYKSDIRAMEVYLYDLFQSMKEVTDV